MTPTLLLLSLALIASSIAPQVGCEREDNSGDAETHTLSTEELITVTDLQEQIKLTVILQEQDVRERAQSHAQVVVTSQTTLPPPHSPSSTQNPDGTQNPKETTSTGGKVNNGTGHTNNIQLRGVPQPPESPSTPPPFTTPSPDEAESYIFIVIVVSLLLVLILTVMTVTLFIISRRRRKEKTVALNEDPYMDADGTEKVPMPMFEDDVPSVMEVEMEDLDQWISKGDGHNSMDSR